MRFFYGGFVASLLVSCGTHLPESELQTNRSAAAPERQEGIRQYQGIVHSYDGQVAFDVTVRAGAGVSEEAARRLLSIVTRPEGSKPLSGGWSKCSDYVTFCTNDVCMCEDAPDPILCQCQLDGEVDDC